MIDEDGLLASFVEESQEHLQTIEPDLLELEEEGDNIDAEVINRIFRSIHSIKGASGFFGLQQIGKLSHIMENLLSLLRDGKISVSTELTDTLLEGVDALRTMVEDVTASEELDIETELTKLQELFGKVSTPSQTVEVTEKVAPGEEKADVLSFEIDEEEIRSLITSGKFLYAVKIYLKEDLEQKEKTPYDYINSIETLGQFVDSFLDISGVKGLDDCMSNDLAFNFIFATVLDPDLVPTGLEVPEERITIFDLDKHDNINKKQMNAPDEEPSSQEELKESPAEDKQESMPVEKKTQPEPKKTKKSTSPAPKDDNKTGRQIQTEEKLRVGVNVLNDLVNLAGELVLGRNQLNEITAPLIKQTNGLKTVLQHVSHVTTEMQEKIMQLRMQPVSVIFGKFHRVVRDISKSLDKEIVLETFGDDVELDKSIIESLSDPLTHIIRNSADHGVETPEEREKKGKPRQGKIELKAYHEGGQVHLDITDDGKGIDPEIVGNKAVEKGLITKEQKESMSDKDLVKLVMKPGFSTAEKISSVSGRGVGMDVVRTNIEHLGGTVEIDSVQNEGTVIRLVLPLTLAIVSGLVIKALDQIFILPEINIDEMVRIKPEEIKDRIDTVQNAQILRLRDILIPLINLKDVLVENSEENEKNDIQSDGNEPLRILILKHGSSRLGLIIDGVENMEEIVVKPLPVYLKKMKCFSGATIMGNGNVALILDIGGIIDKANLKGIEEKAEEKEAGFEKISSEEEIQTLLIFDEGTEERFALPLELITRLESVNVSDIEKIRDQQFIQYQGENLRLIFPEDYLPISRPERKSTEKIGVIIPKMIDYPMGIVIDRVIDTVSTRVELDTSTMMAPGLFGSAVIDSKITLLIDMYRLFEIAAPEWYEVKRTKSGKAKDRKQVLLIEDTAFFRMVVSEYLESAGHHVIEAEDGNRAIKILERQSVDAVVSDILMPGMDGWEVIKTIRGDDRWKKLPVMALTSLKDEDVASRGLEAGFDEWEEKLNKKSLLEKLNSLLMV